MSTPGKLCFIVIQNLLSGAEAVATYVCESTSSFISYLVCCSWLRLCLCVTEMGVMPEIAQAIEEMDWRFVFPSCHCVIGSDLLLQLIFTFYYWEYVCVRFQSVFE